MSNGVPEVFLKAFEEQGFPILEPEPVDLDRRGILAKCVSAALAQYTNCRVSLDAGEEDHFRLMSMMLEQGLTAADVVIYLSQQEDSMFSGDHLEAVGFFSRCDPAWPRGLHC